MWPAVLIQPLSQTVLNNVASEDYHKWFYCQGFGYDIELYLYKYIHSNTFRN